MDLNKSTKLVLSVASYAMALNVYMTLQEKLLQIKIFGLAKPETLVQHYRMIGIMRISGAMWFSTCVRKMVQATSAPKKHQLEFFMLPLASNEDIN